MSQREFKANLYVRFLVDDNRIIKMGLDTAMPVSGLLHDDLLTLMDGQKGVVVMESVVVKDCTPLPTHIESQGVLCDGCQLIKTSIIKNTRGNLCVDCFGTVIPIGQLPKR